MGFEHPFRGLMHGLFRGGGRWREGGRRWITPGSSGEQVKQVQQALGIQADGWFGAQTEEAVKKYQTAQGLPVDGIVGPRTWAKLFPSDKEEPASEEKSGRWGRRWITRGSDGEQVKQVQQALGIQADGRFGSQTEEAVKKYQTAQNLPVDGIVGPRTWAKLFPSADKQPSAPEEKKETSVSSGPEKPWLRRGATGEAVKEVQRAVGVHPDGVFGPLTERAVKDFQSTHGLPVYGIVGPRTWAKIAELNKTAAPAVDAMQVLAGMGFTDAELNARLLRKHNGDLEQVVAEIFGSSQ